MYFDEIVRYARGFSGMSSAEDIAQETFLRALRNVNTLLPMAPKQCRAWLYTTARHVAIDLARREKTAVPVLQEAFSDDLTRVEVECLLGRLEPEERRLVVMRHFQDRTSAEIGEALGIPAATVRTKLRMAMKKLRKLYHRQEA